jgi:spermidine/putrescine transport system substrate-binding protein
MSRGRVEQIGTPEQIYAAPASVFVAGFIGSANLLPGTLDGVSPTGATVRLDSGVVVGVQGVTEARAGDPVTVMLRPERLSLGPNGDGLVRGTVKDVIYQGSERRLIVGLADHTEVIASVDADDGAQAVAPGDAVSLTWAADAPYLLRGRSAVVGATTTDVDEVQASLDGAEVVTAAESVEAPPERHFGRRALIGGGIVVGAAAVIGGVVAATGGGKGGSGGGTDAGGVGTGDSEVRILNWQAYIDPSEKGNVGTVERFKRDTKITATYSENFNSNEEVYNRELAPVLSQGQAIGYDIVCPTNWMAARLKNLGWLDPLPVSRIPNRDNLEERFLTQAWDYGASYDLPWQAGITGMAYNPELTGRELTSINDLFDPAFKGRVAMLTEMRDSVGLVMLGLDIDPTVVDEKGAMAALDKIAQATSDGQIRAFTGNEYLRSLESGDFVACIAWSGDIVQLNYDRPDIKFVIPEEGGMSWYDTMVIPKGAPNAYAAADWMNYVYDPVQAAQITAYVQYLTPVRGVQEELKKMGGDAAALADSPILFPTDEDLARLKSFATLPIEVDQSITKRFLSITGG